MSYSLKIDNELYQLERVFAFIEEVSERFELKSSLTINLNLVFDEVVSNIILYGYPQKSAGKISISVERVEDTLLFVVVDDGVAFDPTLAQEVDVNASIEERSVGGLGILLIHKIMDQLEYRREDNLNRLLLKKNIV